MSRGRRKQHEEQLRAVLRRHGDRFDPQHGEWAAIEARSTGPNARYVPRRALLEGVGIGKLAPVLMAGILASLIIIASSILFGGRAPEATYADAGVVTDRYAPVPSAPRFPEGSSPAALQNRGFIRIGIKFDQPGFGLKEGSKDPKGFDVDIARLMALGIYGGTFEDVEARIGWVEVTSKDRESALQSGEVDIVVATYTMTPGRRQQVDFAGPYFVSHQDIMVRKSDSSINGVDDLAGNRVCTVKGSTSHANLLNQAPEAVAVLKDRYSECAQALEEREVEAVTTDELILAGYVVQSRYAFKLLGTPFSDEPYGIGVKKGDEQLRSFLNSRLEAIQSNGDWAQAARSSLTGIDIETSRPPEIESS